MQFRILPILGLSLALLVACSGAKTVQYRLTFDTQDVGETEEFTKAAFRVIERRVDHLGATITDQKIAKDADGVTVEIGVSDAESADALTRELTAPFDLQVMLATDDAAPDITVEGLGGFKKTGITGDDLLMVTTAKAASGKGASVLIRLTDEGTAKMKEVFRANVGKDLGLFVRGALVSALTIKSADVPNPFVIDGVPDAELAQVFADDVNVGTHVTVTPL